MRAGAAADRPRDRPDRHADASAGRGAQRPSSPRSRSERGAQIVVLIVPTHRARGHRRRTRSASATSWKIGRKDVGDGLLLVVAKNDRDVRIAGRRRRCEGAMPDVAAGRIISEQIAAGVPRRRFRRRPERRDRPARRAHRRRGAAGAAAPSRAARPRGAVGFDWQDLAIFLFVGVPIVGARAEQHHGPQARRARHRRRGRRLGWLLTASLLVAAGAGIVALFLVGVMGVGGVAAAAAAGPGDLGRRRRRLRRRRLGGGGGGFSSGGGSPAAVPSSVRELSGAPAGVTTSHTTLPRAGGDGTVSSASRAASESRAGAEARPARGGRASLRP